MGDKPELTPNEWDALWSWHNDQQHHHADREEYDDAKWHKQRQAEIVPFTTFSERRKA